MQVVGVMHVLGVNILFSVTYAAEKRCCCHESRLLGKTELSTPLLI